MDTISISNGEWKLMNLLWQKQPMTLQELTDTLWDETGWTKVAVNMMMIRLVRKGYVRLEEEGRVKKYYPLVERNDAVRQEAKNTLARIKTGSIGLLLNTMMQEEPLSDAEIDELYRILEEGRKK